MKVNEALAAELSNAGVGAIFTLIGDESAEFVAHATRRGVRLFTGRHETGTVGMADGYSRISGEVGVAVVARGPGLTNALTAILCATRAESGVVVIAGDSSLAWRKRTPEEALEKDRSHKYVPQEQVLNAAMVPNVTLTSPATAAAEFAAILRRARAGGTIVVNIPIDVMRAEAGDAEAEIDLVPFPEVVPPEPAEVDELVNLIEVAAHPVILAGRGAMHANAGDDLRRLATQAGALLTTSLLAKGYFAGDPYSVGVAGGLGTPVALELLREADLVLAFGISLNPMTMYGGQVFPKARIVQIDASPKAFGRYTTTAGTVAADARLTAAAISRALDERRYQATGYRTAEVAERIASFRMADVVLDQGGPGALDPRILMLEIDKALPDRRTVVVDSGRQLTFPSTYLSAPEGGAFLFPHDGGALGGALGVGLGAAIAAPERLTAICLGDGALMMSLADLDTAVRFGLRVVVVISNSMGFAGAVITLRDEGLPEDPARYANPSFEAVARGLGAQGMTVSTLDDLAGLKERLETLDGPLVMDCKTTSEVVPEWVEFIETLHQSQATV